MHVVRAMPTGTMAAFPRFAGGVMSTEHVVSTVVAGANNVAAYKTNGIEEEKRSVNNVHMDHNVQGQTEGSDKKYWVVIETTTTQ